MGVLAGLSAFALFFLSDYNDYSLARRGLRVCFPAGGALLIWGTVLDIQRGTPPVAGWRRGLFFMLAAVFLALLVYTLFFALPPAASYARPGERRQVQTGGVYALCRHPGVLWFAGLYGCLWACTGLPLWEAALYSGLNLGLVVFEDRCVFPAKLEGYGAYQASTPFLLPTRQSIRACRGKTKGRGEGPCDSRRS